jgi:PAS domain S-box-containing protein
VLGLLVILFAALVLIVRRHVHALRRVGRTHRAILDSAAEGIYGVDREGRIVFVNQAVERITGWQPGDIIGRTAHEHLHRTSPDPPEQPSSQSAVLATLADRTPRTVTGELAWRRNGSSFPVDYTVAPVLDAGESAAATVVFTDAIERLAAEEQLRFLATMIP